MLAHFGCYVLLCHVGPCWGLGTMLAMLAHLGAMLAHVGSYVGPSWGYVGPSWGYVGPSWGLCWAKWDAFLGLCLAILTHLDPQVRKMGRSKKHCKTHDIRGVGGRGWAPSLSYGDWPGFKAYAWQPGAGQELGRCCSCACFCSCDYLGPIVSLSWAHVRPRLAYVGPILALSWPYVGPVLPYVGPILALCWPYVGPMLAYVGPMLAHLGAYVGASLGVFSVIYVETPSRRQRVRFFPFLEPETT